MKPGEKVGIRTERSGASNHKRVNGEYRYSPEDGLKDPAKSYVEESERSKTAFSEENR